MTNFIRRHARTVLEVLLLILLLFVILLLFRIENRIDYLNSELVWTKLRVADLEKEDFSSSIQQLKTAASQFNGLGAFLEGQNIELEAQIEALQVQIDALDLKSD